MKLIYRKRLSFVFRKVRDRVFIIALLISCCFWLVNKLSDTYTDVITVPVVITGAITDYDKDIIAGEDKIYYIDCKFNGKGFDLLRVIIRKINVISPEDLDIVRVPGNDKMFQVTIESLQTAISSKFKDLDLIEIVNKTVILKTEFFAQKKVPLYSRVSINTVGEYMQIGTTSIVPDSVMVYGTENIVDTVTHVYTEDIDVNVSREFVIGEVEIPRNDIYEITPRKAIYTIEVGRYTEIKKICKVLPYTINGDKYVIIPDEIEVSLNVAQNKYSQFSIDSITFFVDPSNKKLLDKESSYVGEDKYIVKHSKLPEGVEVRSIFPLTVSVYKTTNE